LTETSVIEEVRKFSWSNFAGLIFEKGGPPIGGYGTAMTNGDDIIVPLFIEGEEPDLVVFSSIFLPRKPAEHTLRTVFLTVFGEL
jgi:hypothetical protein